MTVELGSLTRPELIFTDLVGSDRKAVLREMARRIAAAGLVPDGEALLGKLWEREELGTTGIGRKVAVPHCKFKGLREIVVAVGICAEGVDFDSVDGEPVRVVFTVVSPADQPATHLQSLAAISQFVQADHHVEKILEQPDRAGILRLLGWEGEPVGE